MLFLDFDGPLHPTKAIEGLKPGLITIEQAAQERSLFRWLPLLETLLTQHEDVGIVVHSSWRAFASNSELRCVLGALRDRFMGVTSLEEDRYQGILSVIERFGIQQYLILDDATEKFPQGLPELCVADPETGLSDKVLRARVRSWLTETCPKRKTATEGAESATGS